MLKSFYLLSSARINGFPYLSVGRGGSIEIEDIDLEAGIDGYIEIRNASTGEVTNCIIQVQSKATERPFEGETEPAGAALGWFADPGLATLLGAAVFLAISSPLSAANGPFDHAVLG